MKNTIADLRRGESGVITDISSQTIPVKLYEMGCLPGNTVTLLQIAPFGDPMYLTINGSYLAIRKDMAKAISIEKING